MAAAVAAKAVEDGVARIKLTRDEAFDKASQIIKRAREETEALMKEGLIAEPGE